jgi:hypothetical protein
MEDASWVTEPDILKHGRSSWTGVHKKFLTIGV